MFITGGTFDKEYNYITGKLYFKNTHLDDMLERGRCTLDYQIKTLMMVDSLEMTDKDRAYILEECIASSANRILLTHGTDTMVKTAHYLAEHGLEGKTVVITGAMIPYAFGGSSDGFFNLGSTLAFCQVLPPGIYISMNGKYFDYDKVEKNYETGYFVSK
nr:asparaginase domain-containing protein [Portibacter lacus]